MQKYIITTVILVIIFSTLTFSQDKKHYIGVNVFAPLSFVEVDGAGMIGSMLSNSEYGLSLNGGYFLSENGVLEGRISIGKPNQIYWAPQIHIGYNSFALRQFEISDINLYAGAFLKFYDLYNTETSEHYFNIIPYITIGYWWTSGDLIFDLRVNQTFYALTWSTQEHTKAGSGFFFSPMKSLLQVFPNLSFNMAYRF
ncbi:MAG: hypothetical protein GY936_02265 [Ignavibacteriae bacterium]|nr:hypothetical protein [Ignavibacteriota bacterium]